MLLHKCPVPRYMATAPPCQWSRLILHGLHPSTCASMGILKMSASSWPMVYSWCADSQPGTFLQLTAQQLCSEGLWSSEARLSLLLPLFLSNPAINSLVTLGKSLNYQSVVSPGVKVSPAAWCAQMCWGIGKMFICELKHSDVSPVGKEYRWSKRSMRICKLWGSSEIQTVCFIDGETEAQRDRVFKTKDRARLRHSGDMRYCVMCMKRCLDCFAEKHWLFTWGHTLTKSRGKAWHPCLHHFVSVVLCSEPFPLQSLCNHLGFQKGQNG
jgi:hypothetical protein